MTDYNGFRENVCSECDDVDACNQSENDIDNCIAAITPIIDDTNKEE